MAIKITKEAGKKKAIYFKHCNRCGCEFEFSMEDVKIHLMTNERDMWFFTFRVLIAEI